MIIIVVVSFVFIQNNQNIKKQVNEKEKPEKEVLGVIDGFSVDEDGLLLRRNADNNLPDIKIETQSVRGGEKVSGEEIEKTLRVLKELKKLGLEVKKVEVYNRERMDLIFANNTRIIYNSSVDPFTLSSSLQFMFSRFKIDGRMPVEIDFRYNKPVVRF